MDGDQQWRRQRQPAQVCEGLQDGVAGRHDVVDQDRGPARHGLRVGQADAHVVVAVPLLGQHLVGHAGQGGDVRYPLLALAVRADQHSVGDGLSDPAGHGRRRRYVDRRNAVERLQALDAVQVRVHGHQPVESLFEELRKQRCTDRLAAMEAGVLAHIPQVGCDEADRTSPELARGPGGEAQREGQGIGVAQAGQDRHIGAVQCVVQGDQRLAIGEVPPGHGCNARLQGLVDGAGQHCIGREGHQHTGHGTSPSTKGCSVAACSRA